VRELVPRYCIGNNELTESLPLAEYYSIENTSKHSSMKQQKQQKNPKGKEILLDGSKVEKVFNSGLSPKEQQSLDAVTVKRITSSASGGNNNSSFSANNKKGSKGKSPNSSSEGDDDLVTEEAVKILQENNMVVVENAFDEANIEQFLRDYDKLHDVNQRAIGEKDSSKRSGTRFYNCSCQLGPKCGFSDWKAGSQCSKNALRRTAGATRRNKTNNNRKVIEICSGAGSNNDDVSSSTEAAVVSDDENNCFDDESMPSHSHRQQKPLIWERIAGAFGFSHVARVEVVTSHVGARAQGKHIDGDCGLTIIIALTDISLAKGPTEIDFSIPFFSLTPNSGKVKLPDGKIIYAAMPKGSALIFNANVTHRGTANIGKEDRPILVLDTSLPCEQRGDWKS
jgi:hypothetical protein